MIQPRKWSVPLGSGADVQDLPDDDLRYASFSKIFPQITQVPLSAGGVAPRRIDFNSLFKLLADNIYYYQNGGVFEYSDTADYEKGAIVRYNDKIYLCIQDNSALNTHNPEEMDYWLRVALNNELSDYLPLAGGNITGNLSVQNKNVVRTINDVEADANGNINVTISSLIPNQIIQSPVPLTDANLHLLDGALLSGDGAYADYVAMMKELYNADPTATCWTTESDWQTSVTTYSECGKFVYDSVNNTLRLPKLTSFVQATNSANELGSLVEAGLPSIEHTHSLAQPLARYTPNKTLANGGYTPSDLSSGINYTGGIRENLNPIYGNSNTVQPQAIKYYFYIVIGTLSKTDIQVNIDNVMTDLALKADNDFSNVTAPVQAFKNMSVDWGMPDYSAGITISSSPYVAPEKGFISCVGFESGSIGVTTTLYVNGIKIAFGDHTATWVERMNILIPVNIGDTFTYNARAARSECYFYPCKGI